MSPPNGFEPPDYDLIDQIGARMRESDAVLDRSRDFCFAREDLLEKLLRVVDLAGAGEQLHDLAQDVGRLAGAQLQRDVSFIEKISQIDGHKRSTRFIGLSRPKQLSS